MHRHTLMARGVCNASLIYCLETFDKPPAHQITNFTHLSCYHTLFLPKRRALSAGKVQVRL